MSSGLDKTLISELFNTMVFTRSSSSRTNQPGDGTEPSVNKESSQYNCSFINGKLMNDEGREVLEADPYHADYWQYDQYSERKKVSISNRARHLDIIADVLNKEKKEMYYMMCSKMDNNKLEEKFFNEIIPTLMDYIKFYSNMLTIHSECNGCTPQCTKSNYYEAKGSIIIDVRDALFPLFQALMSIIPAIARGNTVMILAPTVKLIPEEFPFTPDASDSSPINPHPYIAFSYFAKKLFDAGMPNGAVNVVVARLPDQPLVTYSCLIDRSAIICAPFQNAHEFNSMHTTDCSIYMHGESAMLVLRHSDINAAAETALHESLMRGRLTLWPLTKVYVEEHLFGDFVELVKNKLNRLDINEYPKPNFGDYEAYNKAIGFARENNLKFIALEPKCFIIVLGSSPLEMDNSWEIDRNHRIVSIVPVRSDTEGLSMITTRPRILSVSVWTEETSLAKRVVHSLKVGLVWINKHGIIPPSEVGFGNWNVGGGLHYGKKPGLLNVSQMNEDNARSISIPLRCKKTLANESDDDASDNYIDIDEDEDEEQHFTYLPMYWSGKAQETNKIMHIYNRNDENNKEKYVASSYVANSKDASNAISSAAKAFPSWAQMSIKNRAAILLKLANCLSSSASNTKLIPLIRISYNASNSLANEMLEDAADVVKDWASKFFMFSDELVEDEKLGSFLTTRHGIGVVAIIGLIPTFKTFMNLVASALLFGNTVVTCVQNEGIHGMMLADALSRCEDIPAGLINILSDDVQQLVHSHPDVAALWASRVVINKANDIRINYNNFKRIWTFHSSAICPDEWFAYQASKLKTTSF